MLLILQSFLISASLSSSTTVASVVVHCVLNVLVLPLHFLEWALRSQLECARIARLL